LPWP